MFGVLWGVWGFLWCFQVLKFSALGFEAFWASGAYLRVVTWSLLAPCLLSGVAKYGPLSVCM